MLSFIRAWDWHRQSGNSGRVSSIFDDQSHWIQLVDSYWAVLWQFIAITLTLTLTLQEALTVALLLYLGLGLALWAVQHGCAMYSAAEWDSNQIKSNQSSFIWYLKSTTTVTDAKVVTLKDSHAVAEGRWRNRLLWVKVKAKCSQVSKFGEGLWQQWPSPSTEICFWHITAF